MELKVFTLPTCPICPVVKAIANDVAQRLGVAFREVSMATEEGVKEGLAHGILSTPSIIFGDEVLVKGRLISKEKLEEEVRKLMEKWRDRVAAK